MATEVKKVYTLDIQGVDSVNDLRTAIEQLTEKLKQLNQESKEYKDTLKELTDLQSKLAEAMNGIADSTTKVGESLNSVKETTQSVTDSIKNMSDVVQDTKGTLEGISNINSINELKNNINSLKEELQSLEADSDRYKEVSAQLANEQAKLNDAINGLSDSTSNANENLKSITDTSKSASESLNDMSEVSQQTKQNLENIGDVKEGLNSVKDTAQSATDSLNGMSEATQNAKDTLEEISNVNSINDLQTNINSLKEELQGLEEGSERYNEVSLELANQEARLNDAINGLSESTSKANENLKSVTDTSKETSESLNGISDASEKAKESLDSIGDSNTIKGLKEEIKSLKDELYQLKIGSQEYKDVAVELAEKENTLKSVMQELKEASRETKESVDELGESSQQTKEKLDSMGNISSVKDLKIEIQSLRDQLVTLESGSEEYKAVVQELIADETKLKEVMSAGKNEVNAAEGSYNALTQKMSALKKVWKEVTDEATRNEIGQQIKEVNDKLKEMDYSLGNFQRNVGNYKSALEGLDSEFVSQKRELKDLKLAMEQLDPASQAYAEAFNRAAEITHNLSDQQERLKYASTDLGDQLGNIRGIATNLAAGYTAVNAAMGLFGEENENVKEALLKVQQTMALVQGLQGLDGFIKRTQGLSTAMKVWVKTSRESAAATRADAAASAADAAAKGAEATATAGAVAPQLALNAAMKANPIGFIIGLIATLVTVFALLKDKIMEMIGGNEKMKESFDKVKAVLAGFGNIIKKSIINPIKLALIPIKTLGKVMVDVFKGNWSSIGDDIKAGMEEMKDTVIDTINVVGAFKEGYEGKMADIEEKYRKERAEKRAKELESIIKDNEAKYGSDWKYTKEANALYEEMFKSRMEQYAVDSDEYKEAQRDKWEYDREYTAKIQENEDKAEKERAAKAKKYAEERKKLHEKELSDFKSTFEKYIPLWDKLEIDINTMYEKWNAGLDEFAEELVKKFKKFGYSAEEAAIKTAEILAKIQKEWYKSIYNNEFGAIWNSELDAAFYQINRKTRNFVDEENNTFAQIKVMSGITFPEGEINHFKRVWKANVDAIVEEQMRLEDAIDKMFSASLKEKNILANLDIKDNPKLKKDIDTLVEYIKNGNKEAAEKMMAEISSNNFYRESLENALGEYLSEFQKMLDKRVELSADLVKTETELFENLADVQKRVYDKEVEMLDKTYSSQERYYENLTNLRKSQLALYGDRTEESVEAEQEQVMYELRIANLNKLAEAYRNMAADQQLSAEERKNAELELQKALAEIEDAEVAHSIACNERRKASWKNTIDYISTAANGLSNLFGNVATAYEDYINQEVSAGKMSEEEAKRRFETVKGVQKAQTLVNTFASAISAFQSMASIPYVGPVLGAAAAAAAIAAGMVQIANIDSTTWQGNSSGGGSGSSTATYQLPSVLTPEPQYTQNLTNQDDTDTLANAIGDAVGGQKVYVVESDIDAAQKHSRKVSVETTF